MINCPICNANKTKLIFKKQSSNFFKCKNCELIFVWPQPELEENKRMYQLLGEDYYLSKDKITLDFNASFVERLNQLEQYRKNNRLLDVGCSIGAFLSAARSRGWDTYGVEISLASVNYARNTQKLNVFCGTLEEANYKEETFDVVNIWAVLEHVLDPLDVLIESRRILRKGGLLVLGVPNFNCLPIRIIGKRYRYICSGHLFYFTNRSISKLLDRVGFKTVEISSEYFSPLGLIEDLRNISHDTLKTQREGKEIISTVKSKKGLYFIVRPFWKFFKFLIRKFYLGEELRILAIK